MEDTTQTKCGAIDPAVPATSWKHSPCNRLAGHQGDHIGASCHQWTEGSSPLRYLGQDAEGKHIYLSAAPGGLLEALADQSDIESAHVLTAVVRSILEAERTATDAELAAFVPLLTDALERVVGVAARLV
ncbi:hypothetical protein [Streptomyces sp. CoT10]|uniref:hypothetical protein n=1 Tax=Streptomyces sp. CoT10 TaxID=2875762 RepID=UPI001CD4E310|nr:hypothetical protein [Streptomyces sp. CoT10]